MPGEKPSLDLSRAATATRDGRMVVYPTETVYGLGSDALDRGAIKQVFETKKRSRKNPLSLAVPTVDAVDAYTRPTDRETRFMHTFLPGPVTVVIERRDRVPDILTAGKDRVGVRVPDHPIALALLDEVAPLTATSANISGRPSPRRVSDLDVSVRKAAATVIDGGETPGTESTVVDVSAGTFHRRGALADQIEEWLAAN